MSNPSAFMPKVKTELEPGMYMTTYTRTNDDAQESVVRVIEQNPLNIPCDTTIVKQEPIDEPLQSELDTVVKQELQEALEIEDLKTKIDTADCSNLEYVSNIKDEPLDSELEKDPLEMQDIKTEKVGTTDERTETNLQMKEDFVTQNTKYQMKQEIVIEQSYTCKRCTKSFPNKDLLKTHQLTHDNFKYRCKKCLKSFYHEDNLETHLLTHEGISYPCYKCSKTFSNEVYLNSHLLGHDCKVRYPCDKCSKSFTQKGHWKTHQLTHEGIMFPCNECSKSFSRKGNLKTHLLTHKGIRFPCDKCFKSFSREGYLRQHLLTHEGIRFPCNRCSKSFSHKVHLKVHLLTHNEDIIKFTCNRCLKQFSTKRNLKKHLLKQYGISYSKTFCDRCSKSFLSKSSLRRHLQGNVCLKQAASELILNDVNGMQKELLFKCERCSLKFVNAYHLDVHNNGFHDLFVVLTSV